MDDNLDERVRLEQVELIARLVSGRECKEHDREIALNLIAELAGEVIICNQEYCVMFLSRRPD